MLCSCCEFASSCHFFASLTVTVKILYIRYTTTAANAARTIIFSLFFIINVGLSVIFNAYPLCNDLCILTGVIDIFIIILPYSTICAIILYKTRKLST